MKRIFADLYKLITCTIPALPPRRRLLLASAMLGAAIALPGLPACARGWQTEQWTATWGAAPATASASTHLLANQTLRLVVQASSGGNRVRIRLSNETGTAPLRIGAAHIGLRAGGSDVMPGSSRALSFGGSSSITIAPGAPVLSDPVELNVPPLAFLAVSLYLPERAELPAVTGNTVYVSTPGDHTGAESLPVLRTFGSWPFLTGVDVESAGPAVVVLGDGITGSQLSERLAQRLQAGRSAQRRIGVANRSSPGGRLLAVDTGRHGVLARLDRDVLATSSVRYLMAVVGIEDIAGAQPATAEELIAGYRQLIARAHAARIVVIGGTLPPFAGAGSYSTAKEAVRQAVNHWIRSSGEFDAVVDFDLALRDPLRNERLLASYDSGDHVKPNERGYQAMADAVALEMFR
jgi:lysophospholipase L1-like esterase